MIQSAVKMPKPCEFRVHTMEDQVVSGATSCRWDHFYDSAMFSEIEKELQDAFDSMDETLLADHA